MQEDGEKSIICNQGTCSGDQGPTFGGDGDIHIGSNAHSNAWARSSTSFGKGNYYSVPSDVKDQYTILAGARYFKPDELEVFYLDGVT